MGFKGSMQLACIPAITLISGGIFFFYFFDDIISFGVGVFSFFIGGIFLILGLITIIDYKWRYPRKYNIPSERIDNFQEIYILTNKHWIQRNRKGILYYEEDTETLTRKEHFIFLKVEDIKIVRTITPIWNSEKGLGFHTTREVEPVDLAKIKREGNKFETAVSFPSTKKMQEFLDIFMKLRPIESEEERSFGFGKEHLYYLKDEKGE